MRLWWCLKRHMRWEIIFVAEEIERSHSGPHAPETLGAEWWKFAEKLRDLAARLV